MTISILAPALLMAGQPAAAPVAEDFSWILNAPDNRIRSCKIVHRADGGHLIITMAEHGEGDEMQIESSDDTPYVAYNYIFGISAKKPRRFIFTNSSLEKMDQIDIPLRTAMGLRADLVKRKVEPIFIKNGKYTVYIGYGFRSSDESQIFGACSVTLGAK
jgi:hypothetical protein